MAGQIGGTQSRRKGERGREGHRHGGHEKNQDEGQKDVPRDARVECIERDEHHQHGVCGDQVFDDGEDSGFQVAGRLGRSHQLGGLAELRPRARGEHLSGGLAALDHCPGKGGGARSALHRRRLPRQRRLVHLDLAFRQANIGGHEIAHPEVHRIAWDQLKGRDGRPRPITLNAALYAQVLAQHRQRALSSAFLDEAEEGVEQEQQPDDDRLGDLAQGQFQHDRGLQHPRHGSPKFLQEGQERMRLLLGHRIGAVLGETLGSLRAAKAGEGFWRLRRRSGHLGGFVHGASGRERKAFSLSRYFATFQTESMTVPSTHFTAATTSPPRPGALGAPPHMA